MIKNGSGIEPQFILRRPPLQGQGVFKIFFELIIVPSPKNFVPRLSPELEEKSSYYRKSIDSWTSIGIKLNNIYNN